MFKHMNGLIIISLFIMILTLNSPARAEWYTGLMVGNGIPNSLTDVVGNDGLFGVGFSDITLDNSIMAGGKVGYFFEGLNWFGVEVEGHYANQNFPSQTVGGSDGSTLVFEVDKDLRVITVGGNVLVRYPDDWVQPYVGAGAVSGLAGISLHQVVNAGKYSKD